MESALRYLGTKEVSGGASNPIIVNFFNKAGHPQIKDDSVAWCSAFVNAVMYDSGYKGTKSLMARSWLKWGQTVISPRYGDVVIFSRGTDPAFGHVAFFEKWDDKWVYVIGGNQSDSVSRARYPRERLLGFRRPLETGTTLPEMRDTPSEPSFWELLGTLFGAGAAGGATGAAVSPALGFGILLIFLVIGWFFVLRRD